VINQFKFIILALLLPINSIAEWTKAEQELWQKGKTNLDIYKLVSQTLSSEDANYYLTQINSIAKRPIDKIKIVDETHLNIGQGKNLIKLEQVSPNLFKVNNSVVDLAKIESFSEYWLQLKEILHSKTTSHILHKLLIEKAYAENSYADSAANFLTLVIFGRQVLAVTKYCYQFDLLVKRCLKSPIFPKSDCKILSRLSNDIADFKKNMDKPVDNSLFKMIQNNKLAESCRYGKTDNEIKAYNDSIIKCSNRFKTISENEHTCAETDYKPFAEFLNVKLPPPPIPASEASSQSSPTYQEPTVSKPNGEGAN
jgi:hypothetical protein